MALHWIIHQRLGNCRTRFRTEYSVLSIWVKRPPKPDPAKRRPLTPCCFYFPGLAVPRGLYWSHPPVLVDAANAPPVAGCNRPSIPPHCLSFLGRSDCAPPGRLPSLPGCQDPSTPPSAIPHSVSAPRRWRGYPLMPVLPLCCPSGRPI